VKEGLYLNKSERKIISCENSNGNISCNNQFEPEIGFYLSQNITAPLIQCTSSLGNTVCSYSNVADGYYPTYPTPGDEDELYLIKCSSNVCEKIKNSSGWYKSGEVGKAIIHCDGVKMECNSIVMPKLGYYVNGNGNDVSGNYLLNCLIEGKGVNCKEYKPTGITIGSKYFKNAAFTTFENEKVLIKCNNEGCGVPFEIENSNTYYVNGVNSQLIYYIAEGICNEFPVN